MNRVRRARGERTLVAPALPAAPGPDGVPALPPQTRLVKAEPHTIIWVAPGDSGQNVVFKMYRKTGFADRVRERLFRFRVEREYRVLARLHEHGVSCTPPLFWTRGRHASHGFYELLATRELLNVTELRVAIRTRKEPDHAWDLGPLFGMVRQMHECGVYHGALSPRNVLVRAEAPAGPVFHLADMARARLFSGSVAGTELAWVDLLQAVIKLDRELGSGYCRPFLVHYGLDSERADRLYREAARYGVLQRSDKRNRNALELRAFRARCSVRMREGARL